MGATRRWWLVGITAQVAVLVATALPPFTPGLGEPLWHHHVSLLAVLGFTFLAWQRMAHDRRFLSIGVLITTLLALLSAFLLLYLKQDLKDAGLKDWAKWWHVAWSWAALAFFAGHTWVNRSGLARAVKRITEGWRGKVGYAGVLAAILVAVPLTWSAWGAANFTDENYIPLTLATWVVLLLPAYALWLHARRKARRGLPEPAWAHRGKVQYFLDAWLVPMTLLANVSGFPILYLATKDTALKYVAKYWHTWPSIAMAILVFAHTVQFWPAMVHYARSSARRGRRGPPDT